MSFRCNPQTVWLILGAVLLLVGLPLLRDAWLAESQHSFVPAVGAKAPWMSPFQAYAASALCLGFGLYCVIRGFIRPKR